MTIAATYVNSNTFTVVGNQTVEFHAGRRVKLIGDSTWYGTIESVNYSGNTSIVLTSGSDNIDNTLTEVYYGIVSAEESSSSMPIHTHDGDEGSGGQIDHTDLTNKGSNTHLEIDSHITNTNASITTLSGSIDTNTTNLSTLSGTVDNNTSDIATLSGTVDSYNSAIGLNTAHRTTTSGNPHQVTKTDVGLGNVPNTDFTSAINTNTSNISTISGTVDSNTTAIGLNTNHRNTTVGNPHQVTKAEVGLGNVPNTDFTSAVNANNAFRTTPSSIITAGNDLEWSGNTLNSTAASATVEVYNNTGTTISSGKLVRINGSFGAVSSVAVADKDTCSCVDAFTIEDISAGTTGIAQVIGSVQESFINTFGMTAGNVLYLGDDGDFTETKPTSGYIIKIGKVKVVAGSNGAILVNLPAFSVNSEDISDFDTEVSNNTTVTSNTSNIATLSGTVNSHSTKLDYITVTQEVDLDTLESDVATNNAKLTNANHTGEVTGSGTLTIADNVIDEANLKLDEGPTNDYVLTADDTKSGGMKWATVSGGISELSEDTSPQLGGDLDAAGNAIVAADHGTATSPQVVNVVYGTGTAPTASTTTEGTLFIKYTA